MREWRWKNLETIDRVMKEGKMRLVNLLKLRYSSPPCVKVTMIGLKPFNKSSINLYCLQDTCTLSVMYI